MDPRAAEAFIQRILDLEARIDRLERASKRHTETKTFQVEGEINESRTILPFVAGLDADRENPESKVITHLRGRVLTGTVTLEWYVNAELIPGAEAHVITTSGLNDIELEIPYLLPDAAVVQPVVAAVDPEIETGYLFAACVMATRAT